MLGLPGSSGGGCGRAVAFRLKLFCPAQASISVPSTVKCSSDSSCAPGPAPDLIEEGVRHIPCKQALAVLAEGRGIPDRVSMFKPDEPAKQQVVVELLHQQPLAADRVEHLQQQRAQQLLRRNRGPTGVRA